MAKNKTNPLKKPLTEINEIGKKLNKDGVYLIEYDTCELISSSIKDNDETYNITIVTLDEKYKEYLPYLGFAVDGKYLNRVLKGTGVEISNEDYKVYIESMVKIKDEKVKFDWESNQFTKNNIRFEILKNMNKLQRVMKSVQNTDYHSSYNYDVNTLIEEKKFIHDVSEYLNTAVLKVTNKMMKTLNKSTISVTSHVTNPIINKEDQIKRMHIIETVEPQGIVRSYYPFIDK